MARISGIGAKKLDRYGATFLEVITGRIETPTHPARKKLAGHATGPIYDRLLAMQADLIRGPDGTGKPMSCSAALLARIAALGSGSADQIDRLLGDRLAERFGPAFADILRED